jgi:hypothetical protein
LVNSISDFPIAQLNKGKEIGFQKAPNVLIVLRKLFVTHKIQKKGHVTPRKTTQGGTGVRQETGWKENKGLSLDCGFHGTGKARLGRHGPKILDHGEQGSVPSFTESDLDAFG